jgi:hypothetical protein
MDFQFISYENEEQRGMADEQVRAFVGERLAELPAVEIESLSPEQRALYDRVLLRCEFANQLALAKFTGHATPQSITNTHAADMEIVRIARDLDAHNAAQLDDSLRRLEEAFEKRDKAMLGQ